MHKRKSTVLSVIGGIILSGMIIALMIFTATRTVHFLQQTFPPDMAYIAYLALAAFDIGIIGWMMFAVSSSEGPMQRAVAYLMVFVCLMGVVLTTIADTVTSSAANGLTKAPPYMTTVGIWGTVVIILLNVVAGIVIHLADPHHIRKFELENVHDDIHRLTMQHIKDRALDLAPQIAMEHTDHWVRQTVQEVVGSLPASSQTRQLAAPKVIDADKSDIVYASNDSRTQIVDPYGVRKAVDSSRKSIEKKESLMDKLKGSLNFSLPKTEKAVEAPVEVVEEEEIETALPSFSKSYHDWTGAEWKKAKDELDAFDYAAKYQEVFGEEPPVKAPAKKKRAGGKKPKNATESLGE